MTLNLEVGKTYVNGMGAEVKIVRKHSGLFIGIGGGVYSSCGSSGMPHPWRYDLIREVSTGPVRTVTKKEIVTGQYGSVYIESDSKKYVTVGFSRSHVALMTKSTLAETIRTLQEIHDAMED